MLIYVSELCLCAVYQQASIQNTNHSVMNIFRTEKEICSYIVNSFLNFYLDNEYLNHSNLLS